MPLESSSPAALSFIAQVELAYTGLMRHAAAGETNLGGKLLYAGELDSMGRALTAAGNISGTATLAASANPALLRHATREGVIDFQVNSLDEALRILKNEIRKHEPVAVGVSLAPETIVKEMIERGVLPDLLPPLLPSTPAEPDLGSFIDKGTRPIDILSQPTSRKLLIWPIPTAFAQRPAEFDAFLLQHLPQNDNAGRRWLRLSPRYLGPQARRLRSLESDQETAAKLIEVLGPPLKP